MTRYFLLFFLFVLPALPVQAQFYGTQYRAPGQKWMEVNTEQFRLIYPGRYQKEAYRSLAILESEYAEVRDLVGGDFRRVPFILNPENDRSNGFVSPMNFRSEVEISPIISKSMNPKSGGWLELVLPHELVHTLHFSSDPKSFTRLLTIFSPDMRRSVHAAAPLGFLEGIAVQYESHHTVSQAGRGNYPYFRNQFRSVLGTSQEWSMGQLIHTTTYTPPFNRHYIGGYEFVNWLLYNYGMDSMKQAIEFHYHYPFLGFGTALRHETGLWPGELYNRFNEEKKEKESERLAELGNSTDSLSKEIPFSATCKRLHRPRWLDNNTLVFYGQACNRTYGFYTYQLDSDSLDLLKEVSISDDFIYSLSEDKNHLAYSRYHSHVLFDNLYQGDLHRLNIETGNSERITKSKRLFSPSWFSGDLLAVQTVASEMGLVRINPQKGEVVQEYSKPDHSTIVQSAPNHFYPGNTAIVGRIKNIQGIWFENLEDDASILDGDPGVVFGNGSIFDLSWHPTEEKLLFVSDHTGVMNIFEYDLSSEEIHQLTDSQFNVFEASYSPDGSRIAYIQQDENEQTVHILNVDDALWKPIVQSEWQFDEEIEKGFERPQMRHNVEADASTILPKSYSTGFAWLKPRLWLPTYEETNGFHRPGLTFESVDVMNSQAYSIDMSVMADRFWYDASYTYKGFYPGFQFNLFDVPSLESFRTDDEETETFQELLQQSRGASLRVPIPLTLENNMRFSSLFFEPQYFVSQIRFLDPYLSSVPVSGFGTRHTLGFRTVFNWNIRQFIRDVQPNSGWAFFIEGRHALNTDQFTIETEQLLIDGTLVKRRGLRAGITTFLSPLKRWNQSLRLSGRVYTQMEVPVFGIISRYSDLFSENPLPGANNVGLLDTRYTIPLIYPEDGGLLLPFYLSNIYLVLFSQTVADFDRPDYLSESRSVLGAGIRSRFRLSNLTFDLGIAIGWEPRTNDITYHFGNF